MKIINTIKHSYRMVLVALMLGLAGFAGYGQDKLHTPYPIIFIHGINGSDKSWDTDGYDIVDFLQSGHSLLKYGGVIDITLDHTRSTTTLSNTIEEDVFPFTTNLKPGDFYVINFNVHALGGTPGGDPEDDYKSIGHVLLDAPIYTNDNTIAVTDPQKFKAGDIIRIQNEIMLISKVSGSILEVERGKLSTKAYFHFLPNEIFNLSNESNQASIAKQGAGVKLAIDAVLKANKGAKKVVLVGHSMGGLAAREYIQSSKYSKDVAKLVTIGTPHYGSDITNFPTSWAAIDDKSDAVRDLRTTISYKNDPVKSVVGEETWIAHDGLYLFGGPETILPDFNNNKGTTNYYSKDVNGNGSENDFISGLDEFSKKPFPDSISCTWIVSSITGYGDLGNDVMVHVASQFNFFGDTLRTKGWHKQEPTNITALIRGLDEPGVEEFAYEISEKSTNMGFITFGTKFNPLDIDLYKLILKKDGKLTINVSGKENSGVKLFRILDENQIELKKETNINNSIEYEANKGTYYIQIKGIANDYSLEYPYILSTFFVETPPAAMSVSPTTLQFYDVVMSSPKSKTITLTNNGTSDIIIKNIDLTGSDADHFKVEPTEPFTITPESPQDITVTFDPTIIGPKEATIEISTNSPDIPVKTVSLKGNATDHETKVLVSSIAESYNYGSIMIGNGKNKTITLQNTGSMLVAISDLALEGLNPDEYSITSPTDHSFDLTTGAIQQIVVRFSPTAIGAKNATLVIYNNSDNHEPKLSIELYGNGTENYYSGNNNTLVSYEYWFDDQYNNKVSSLVTPSWNSQYELNVPTTDLNTGLHSYHIRYLDSKGKWSAIVSEFFHKLPVTIGGIRKITGCEYWFDSDYENKVATPVTPEQSVTANNGIGVASLQNGLHSFHVRYKDDAGQWSSVVSEFFHKLPVTTGGTRKITGCEYWFDSDYANKVATPVTPEQTITVNNGIGVTSLPNGLHSFHVRYKDDAGQWSSVVSEFFHKLPITAGGIMNITGCEYWFDSDYANKVETLVNAEQTVTVNNGIGVASLQNGLHSFHVRYKDDAGQWSSVVSEFFHKLPFNASQTNLITTYRYWFDGNDAAMNTVILPTPVNPYFLIRDLDTKSLSLGDHSVHFQFEDANHAWSSVASQSITIENLAPIANAGIDQSVNEGVTVTLDGSASYDPNGNTLTYKWTVPAEIVLSSTTDVKPSFSAPEVKKDTAFTFSLVVNDGVFDSPAETVVVTVKNLSSVQEIPLIAGWNIISANVVPANVNLKDIFQSQINSGNLKKVMEEAGKTIENFGIFGGWKNNIGNLLSTEGYKVNMGAAATLSLEGPPVPLPLDIPLSAGWNIISYPCTTLQDGKALVQSLITSGKLIKVMDESGKTIENFGIFGGWKNNIGNFVPGKGYKVNAASSCILTIPAIATKAAAYVPEALASTHFTKGFEGNGTDHMNISLVDLQASGLQAGDEIGIFDGKYCVGAATIGMEQIKSGSMSIPASANEGSGTSVNGFSVGNTIGLQLYRGDQSYTLNMETLAGSQSFEKNGTVFIRVSINELTDIGTINVEDQFFVYPNPFTSEITIEIQNSKKTEVDAAIYNLLGQRIKNLFNGINEGHLLLKWNGTSDSGQKVVPGIYFCKVNNETKKVFFKEGK